MIIIDSNISIVGTELQNNAENSKFRYEKTTFSKEIKNFWSVTSNSSSISRYFVKQNVDYFLSSPISSAESLSSEN